MVLKPGIWEVDLERHILIEMSFHLHFSNTLGSDLAPFPFLSPYNTLYACLWNGLLILRCFLLDISIRL